MSSNQQSRQRIGHTNLFLHSFEITKKLGDTFFGRIVVYSPERGTQPHSWTAIRRGKKNWEITGEGAMLNQSGRRVPDTKSFPFSLDPVINNALRAFIGERMENHARGLYPDVPLQVQAPPQPPPLLPPQPPTHVEIVEKTEENTPPPTLATTAEPIEEMTFRDDAPVVIFPVQAEVSNEQTVFDGLCSSRKGLAAMVKIGKTKEEMAEMLGISL